MKYYKPFYINAIINRCMILVFLISSISIGQTVDSGAEDIFKIRLKSREFTPSKNVTESISSSSIKKNHILLQFNKKLSDEIVEDLRASGIKIDSWVSPTTLAVNIKDAAQIDKVHNVRWVGTLNKTDKISEKLNYLNDETYVIVELHSSLHKDDYLELLKNTGAQVINNLYLNNNTVLLKVNSYSLNEVSELNEVAYIYPAPQKVVDGKKVYQCAGASTPFGRVAYFVKNGEGWDGPGLGSVNLKYYFENGTPDVSGEKAEVIAALWVWSQYADIDWTETSVADAQKSFDILWGAGEHGDNNPFDGPSNILAHGYYPDDINSGSIAGDIHFDEDENWRIGEDIDVFSVALHEAGHALGLNHSDDLQAVMYKFYSVVGDLKEDDINGIRALYKSRTTPRTAAPVFNPPQGIYESPLEIHLQYGSGSNSGNTQIKYTIDGSEPTAYSFDYIPDQGDYIFQRYSNTIKARAFRQDHTPSEVVKAMYILTPATPTVAKPSMDPEGGVFVNSVQVSLESTTDFAVIRYTTDGSEPTETSVVYSGPLTLVNSTTLKAKGFRTDYAPSPTTVASFEIITQVKKPKFYPLPNQVFAGATNIFMETETLGATIRYTTDGSIPTESSTIYSGPITINNTTTFKAKGFMDSAVESEVSEATYYIVGKVDDPSITPNGGTFTDNVQVTITTATPNATIRYTTNGTEPTITSDIYTEPFILGIGNHWVCAKAFLEGADPSDKVCENYEVYSPSATTVETPTMTPFSTQTFVNEIPISMDCRTEGAIIRYTVGTNMLPQDPTESGPGAITYTGPFSFGVPNADVSFFFKVRAFKTGLNPSEVIQSGALSVVVPVGKMDKPTITPNGGTFNNPVEVTLASTTNFANLIYTDDGSEPDSFLPILPPTKKYNSPFNLSQAKTITVKAFRPFFEDSDTTQAEFIFKCAAPVITPESGEYIDSVKIMITSETENSKIKYTLDGTAPNENSEEYTEPITLGVGAYSLKAKAFKTNFIDSEISNAEFEVMKAPELPVIITDLQDIVAVEGEKVVFKVKATGTPAPSFQWLRNNVNLPQEISDSLVLENIQIGDAGNYSVLVSNSAGSVLSEEVTLVVNPITDVDEIVLEGIPTDYKLYGNYPNPFNPSTRIKYGIPEKSSVSLKVFNILGENVVTLTNEIKNAGYYEKNWNASNLSSGVYFLQFKAVSTTSNNQISSVHKLLLLK